MNQVELRAAQRAGLLEEELESHGLCYYLDRIIVFLKDLQSRTPRWKLWLTVGMGAAIGALEALRNAQCGRQPFHLE